ncbi:MAG TPA: hypothetical protein PKI14_07920 [Fervidobacterium sp.]|nr:hypothetical protein [Fervidobacterium sp.]
MEKRIIYGGGITSYNGEKHYGWEIRMTQGCIKLRYDIMITEEEDDFVLRIGYIDGISTYPLRKKDLKYLNLDINDYQDSHNYNDKRIFACQGIHYSSLRDAIKMAEKVFDIDLSELLIDDYTPRVKAETGREVKTT